VITTPTTRPTTRPTVALLAAAVSAVLLVAGCGGSGAKSTKAAFCSDNATLNTGTQKATDVAGVIAYFKANVATIDDFGRNAPSDIKADAQKLVTAAHKVIDSGDIKAFTDNAVAAAGKHVDSYCGTGATTTT
jgi:hypothetical protein